MPRSISFERDGLLLRGTFRSAGPDGQHSTILLLQGSPGNPHDVLGIGENLARHGYSSFTFNYAGTLDSEGLSSFANAQLDIAAAHRFLIESEDLGVDPARLILGGWSYGGGMALTYAAGHPEVTAVFSIAGTDHGEFMREYEGDAEYRGMVDQIFAAMAQPESPWRLAPGATPSEALALGTSVDAYDLRKAASSLAGKQVLLVGGWDDTNVKIDNHILPLYRALQAGGSEKVTMVAFQDDHSFEKVRDKLVRTVLDWMDGLVFETPIV